MTDFEKWKIRYDKNWATRSQLKMLVQLQVITAVEYEQITGEVYVA